MPKSAAIHARTECVPNPLSSLPHADRAPRPIDETDPAAIHQFTLDITGLALETGDFDLFAAFFHLPHHIETFGASVVLRTQRDLRVVFDNSRTHVEHSGIARRVRDCISASFQGADTILATHVSRVMHGHQQLREPVPCHSVLERIGGLWKVVRSSYAIEESDKPYDRLLTRRGRPLDIRGE